MAWHPLAVRRPARPKAAAAPTSAKHGLSGQRLDHRRQRPGGPGIGRLEPRTSPPVRMSPTRPRPPFFKEVRATRTASPSRLYPRGSAAAPDPGVVILQGGHVKRHRGQGPLHDTGVALGSHFALLGRLLRWMQTGRRSSALARWGNVLPPQIILLDFSRPLSNLLRRRPCGTIGVGHGSAASGLRVRLTRSSCPGRSHGRPILAASPVRFISLSFSRLPYLLKRLFLGASWA